MGLGKEDGALLIKAAREAIEHYFDYGEIPSVLKGVDLDSYNEPRGVFVTLKEKGQLRGCIGFPLPMFPLGQAVCRAAVAAAFDDFRFTPLKKEELKNVDIELSVLSVPEQIIVEDPNEYLEKKNRAGWIDY